MQRQIGEQIQPGLPDTAHEKYYAYLKPHKYF